MLFRLNLCVPLISGSLDNLLLVRSSGGLVAGRGRAGGRVGGRAGGRVSIVALNILEDGGQGNPGIAFVIPVAVQQSLQGVELDMLALDKVSGIATVLVLPANQLLASGNLAIVQVVGQDGELVLSGEVARRSSNIFLSAVLILDILDGDVLQLDIGLEVSVEVQVSNTVLIDVLASQFLQGLEGDLLTSGILSAVLEQSPAGQLLTGSQVDDASSVGQDVPLGSSSQLTGSENRGSAVSLR